MPRQGWTVEEVRTPFLWGELYAPEEEMRNDAAPSEGIPQQTHTGAKDRPVRPALVIMPSSAGVCDIRERFYARYFAQQGCLCLITDSFARRGLTQCMTDQTLHDDGDMLEDARAAFRWLTAREDVGSVGILGVSKGGLAALNAALVLPGQPPMPAFALHVCIVPSCAVQLRHPRVSGAPMLFLLGGKDDYTRAEPALRYAEAITRENDVRLETVVFPEAHHGWELCGKPQFYPQAESYGTCLFYREDDGSITNATTGESLSPARFRERLRSFAHYGAHAGGGTGALRRATCETILDFMRRTDFLSGFEHVS